MATELGSLYYKVGLDDEELKKGVDRAEGSFRGLVDSASGASKAMLGVLAGVGAAAVGFGAKSVSAFAESEQAVTQLEAALKSTGAAGRSVFIEDLDEMSSHLMDLTGVSDEAVTSSQAMLATFTNIGGKGKVFDRATETILDMATAMNGGAIPAADQLRNQAIQLGKAINSPKDGLTALTRVGVTFTEEQKKMIETLQDSGDLMGAQTAILDELQKEFGGSAEAAGNTFAGSINKAKETVGELMETVGELIVDRIRPLIDAFTDFVSQIMAEDPFVWLQRTMQPVLDNMPILIGFILAGLLPAFISLGGGIIAATAPLIPFLAAGAAIGYLVQRLIEHFGGWKNLLDALQPTFVLLKGIWQDAILPLLQQLWDSIANKLWPALKQLWDILGPILLPVLKALGVILGATIIAAIMLFIEALNVVIRIVSAVITYISLFIAGIKQLVKDIWDGIKKIPEAFSGLVDSVKTAMSGVKDAISSPFTGAFDAIKRGVAGAVERLRDLNPFTRHSPSLVDMVTKGTYAIEQRYGMMFDRIASMAGLSMPQINFATAAPVSPNFAASSESQVINRQPVNVSLQAGAFMGTPSEARYFAEQIQIELDRINAQKG